MNKTSIFTFSLAMISLIVAITFGIQLNDKVNTLQSHHVKTERYSYALDCIREAEIKYWGYKSDLVDEVQAYIDQIAPTSNLRAYALIEECEHYDVDICFVLTQAEIESHYGTKGLGAKINNVFNHYRFAILK